MASSSFFRRVERAAFVIGRLGPISGVRSLWRFYANSARHGVGAPRAFPVPGCEAVAWMRPGTTDWHVFEQIFVRQDYDLSAFSQSSRLLSEYKRLVSAGKVPVIIDCGANIGLSAIWFKLAFPEAAIFAIEPDHRNFAVLERNIAPFSNVAALRSAVWDRKSLLTIANPDAEAWSFEMEEREPDESNEAVKTVTIPEILETIPNAAYFIVKIDIEGGERHLFRSNTGWLDHVPLVIIEFHDWKLPWEATAAAFFSAASQRKRDYLFRSENLFCFLHQEMPDKALDPGHVLA